MIEVEGLSKHYQMGEAVVRALDEVSFTIGEGELVAIMGPSGSGKSTLMNILGCLDVPTSGSYRLAGREVSTLDDGQLSEVRGSEIGFVFQTFNLLPRLTAQRNVEVPLLYTGAETEERRERAQQSLKLVGLEDRAHHRPNELSGGQRQRVAIARALVNQPSMILADEPTGNLDLKTTYEILDLFAELNQSGHTIVVVTHEKEVAACTRRVLKMREGEIFDEVQLA